MTGAPSADVDARLLLIDDDAAFIQIFSRLLARYPDQRFATSAAEGLALARETKPDLIFLDVEMPEMDGIAFCEQLKADPALADVPVIFVTSHARIPVASASFKAGGVDFITKPVNQRALLERVGECLERKRAAEQKAARVRELLRGLEDNGE